MFKVVFGVLFCVSLVAAFVLPMGLWTAIVWAAFSVGAATTWGAPLGVLLAVLCGWFGIAPSLWIFAICLIWAKLFAELCDA